MLDDVFRSLAPVRPDATCAEVLDVFARNTDWQHLAVVGPDQRPLGLVDRCRFTTKLATQYGFALHSRRLIGRLMDPTPLVVERRTKLLDFASAALSHSPSAWAGGFIVVEDGLYVGVGTSLDLIGGLHRQLQEEKEAIAREKLFMEQLIDSIPAMLLVKTLEDRRVTLANRAAEEVLGVSRAELIGHQLTDFLVDGAGDGARPLWSGGQGGVLERKVLQRTGEERCLTTRHVPLLDAAGVPRWILRVSEDVTEVQRAQARIAQLAHYDPLTGLANRVLFQEHLERALAGGADERGAGVVLCIDLDRFKAVNDTLGHAAGDELLRLVGQRLQACLRAGTMLARLGGDEFAALLTGLDDVAAAQSVAARMVETVCQPFNLFGHRAEIGASIGMVRLTPSSREPDVVMQQADLAMYRAKEGGRGRVEVFHPDLGVRQNARRQMEHDLRWAIRNGGLTLHYQPLVHVASGQVRGLEALARWQRRDGQSVAPAIFIPMAEELGLLPQLGRFVLRAACDEAATWPAHIVLSVNVSPREFREPGWVDAVAATLRQSGLSPGRLEIEIPEAALLPNDETSFETLEALQALGCQVALDDFGTGFASMSYLQRFRFSKLKIDQSFVRELPHNQGSMTVVRAMAALAHSLGMVTTAEGVETAAQLAEVTNGGCDQAQGYLLGRPMPAHELGRFLSQPAEIAAN